MRGRAGAANGRGTTTAPLVALPLSVVRRTSQADGHDGSATTPIDQHPPTPMDDDTSVNVQSFNMQAGRRCELARGAETHDEGKATRSSRPLITIDSTGLCHGRRRSAADGLHTLCLKRCCDLRMTGACVSLDWTSQSRRAVRTSPGSLELRWLFICFSSLPPSHGAPLRSLLSPSFILSFKPTRIFFPLAAR